MTRQRLEARRRQREEQQYEEDVAASIVTMAEKQFALIREKTMLKRAGAKDTVSILDKYRRIFVCQYCSLAFASHRHLIATKNLLLILKGHCTISFLWKFEPDILDKLRAMLF